MNPFRTALFLLLPFLATLINAQQPLKLWYATPAADWNAALPIGNGTLAAMVFGGPAVDRLQLNEGSVREWASAKVMSNSNFGMPYQSMGDLYLRFPGHTAYKGYIRDLNISSAVASVKYAFKGVIYTREYYASLCDSVIVVRLKASKPKSITCNIAMTTPYQKYRINEEEGKLILTGVTETNERQAGKVRFITQVKPLLKNGRCTVKDGVLSIDKADEATIYISMANSFVNYQEISGDEVAKCTRILNRAYGKEFDILKANHTVAYQKLFNRVSLDLGTTPQALKPTDQRIREFAKVNDPALAALYFQFGRYLLITCSQSGGEPSMQQGIWSNKVLDIWEHYQYTGDKAFLQVNYPIMLEAAHFFVDFLVKEPSHGWLVVCPSSSPENNPKGTGGNASNVTGCNMNNQIVYDLFTNVLAATDILNGGIKGLFNTGYKAFGDTLRNTLAQMPPMQIGQFSQLQEWMNDWVDPKDQHRPISSLFGLYPGNQISPNRTPELFDAARNSLINRGDISNGWAMSWQLCFWTRLLDGNHAYKILQKQFDLFSAEPQKNGTFTNLFCAHPPFQVDGNFGCTAGITEMLLQSQDGFIFVLPALPDVWKIGSVKGLKARGGFEFDVTWKDNAVETLKIRSLLGGNCRIRSAVELIGKGLKPAKGENSNPYYRVAETPKPLISEKAKLKPVVLPETQLYDLKMNTGEILILSRKI